MEQTFIAIPTWAFGLVTSAAIAIMGTLAHAFWRFADRLIKRDDLHDKRINGLDNRVTALEAQERFR